MNTQWGKKIISVNNIEKITTIVFMSSVKMYKNLDKGYMKPADLTFIIIEMMMYLEIRSNYLEKVV